MMLSIAWKWQSVMPFFSQLEEKCQGQSDINI